MRRVVTLAGVLAALAIAGACGQHSDGATTFNCSTRLTVADTTIDTTGPTATITGRTDADAKVQVAEWYPEVDVPEPNVTRDGGGFRVEVQTWPKSRLQYTLTAESRRCPLANRVNVTVGPKGTFVDATPAPSPVPDAAAAVEGWKVPGRAVLGENSESVHVYTIDGDDMTEDELVEFMKRQGSPAPWSPCDPGAGTYVPSDPIGTWFREAAFLTVSIVSEYTEEDRIVRKVYFATDPDDGLDCLNRPGGIGRLHENVSGVVGTPELPAGMWKSGPGIANCYWEIAAGSGETIDNHFGMSGATVRLKAGQQFRADGCGTWSRAG